jgi:hypothetical protein
MNAVRKWERTHLESTTPPAEQAFLLLLLSTLISTQYLAIAQKVVTIPSDTVTHAAANHDLHRATHSANGSEIVTDPRGEPDFEG